MDIYKPKVSICIPAWQSEPYIKQTLECACNQVYENLHILVSVDRCQDNTLEICQGFATRDSRIQVFAQDRQQGWAGNVNFLLSKITSPLFAFYWHDDIIGPDWVEQLATGLINNPGACSAYGATRHFGGVDWLDNFGKSFLGPTVERLFEVLTHTELYGLTRCMMRRELIQQGLKIPNLDGRDYYENNNPFWLKILASGPMLYVPEAEYHRRNGTGSSVVDGWVSLPRGNVVEGMRQNVNDCMLIIRESLNDPVEVKLINYCLYLFIMRRVRLYELGSGQYPPIDPEELGDKFHGVSKENILFDLDRKQRWSVTNAQAGLLFLEGKYWRKKGHSDKTLAKFTSAMKLNPHHGTLASEMIKYLEELGRHDEAQKVHDQIITSEKNVP